SMKHCLWLLPICAACASDLGSLVPFPCARDGTCPIGLSCLANQCVKATVDAPCDATTDCTPAGDGAACALGVCTLPCGASRACPTARACSTMSGAGVCLADCTASGSCANGLSCRDLFYGGKRGCTGASSVPSACVSFATAGQCTWCGGVGVVSCGGGI